VLEFVAMFDFVCVSRVHLVLLSSIVLILCMLLLVDMI
jgi:hypothetical protein